MKTLLTISTLLFSLFYFSLFNQPFGFSIGESAVSVDTVYRYETTCNKSLVGISSPELEGDEVIITVTSLASLTISSEKLIAYYPFEPIDGVIAVDDMSGFRNNGKLSESGGVILEKDSECNNHYFVFDGENGFIKFENHSIRPRKNITVSMWVRVDKNADTMMLFHNDVMSSTLQMKGFGILVSPEKKLQAIFGDGGAYISLCSYRKKETLDSVLSPNQWHHISVIFSLQTQVNELIDFENIDCSIEDCKPLNACFCADTINAPNGCSYNDTCTCSPQLQDCLIGQDSIHIYVDGVRKSLGEWEGCGSILAYSPNSSNTPPALIGLESKYQTPKSRFKGKLDDLLVFNRILSEEEIQRLAVPKCELPIDTIRLGETPSNFTSTGIDTLKNKCDEDSLLLIILPPLEKQATGFTPNGDNYNDCFIITNLQAYPNDYPNNELIVYNSNGQIVYQARPYRNDWCGRDREGKELPIGSYGYVYVAGNGEKPIKAMVSINR